MNAKSCEALFPRSIAPFTIWVAGMTSVVTSSSFTFILVRRGVACDRSVVGTPPESLCQTTAPTLGPRWTLDGSSAGVQKTGGGEYVNDRGR